MALLPLMEIYLHGMFLKLRKLIQCLKVRRLSTKTFHRGMSVVLAICMTCLMALRPLMGISHYGM